MTPTLKPERPSGSPGATRREPLAGLPDWHTVLVVVAHPDDESFGLGAIIDAFVRRGSQVDVLCFTQGEASTLGASASLATIRADELQKAASALGARSTSLMRHPDGALRAVDTAQLDEEVAGAARDAGADGLLVFDDSGVTGHPDHIAATASAVRVGAALNVGVLAWTLSGSVAAQLRIETGVPFHGEPEDAVDISVVVDRTRQRVAIACHPSQAVPGSVLWRRLELQGDVELLRWLNHPSTPEEGA